MVFRMQGVWGTSDIGQGSGAVAWLTGDFTGSGTTQIAQLWNNRDRLGLIIYGYRDGVMQPVPGSTSDIDQYPVAEAGSEALAWLTGKFGDFLGAFEPQIAQLWNDNGRLQVIIYGYVDGAMRLVENGLAQEPPPGPEALAWLTGNFSGQGPTQIAQLFVNYGLLALRIYGAVSVQGIPAMGTVGDNLDTGQGPGALAWLTGDFTGTRKTQIAQPWDNNGQLGLIIYGEAEP
jgi:hypothetical protein